MIRGLALTGAFASLALAPSAWAQVSLAKQMEMIDLSDPANVVKAVQDEGFKAKLDTGKDGDPFIVSAANGNEFRINFFDCDHGKKCKSMEFTSWWKKQPYITVELANEWNATKRFLKVVIDKDGDLAMYMDLSAVGRVSYEFFADTLDWYVQMDGALTRFLAEKKPKT